MMVERNGEQEWKRAICIELPNYTEFPHAFLAQSSTEHSQVHTGTVRRDNIQTVLPLVLQWLF